MIQQEVLTSSDTGVISSFSFRFFFVRMGSRKRKQIRREIVESACKRKKTLIMLRIQERLLVAGADSPPLATAVIREPWTVAMRELERVAATPTLPYKVIRNPPLEPCFVST